MYSLCTCTSQECCASGEEMVFSMVAAGKGSGDCHSLQSLGLVKLRFFEPRHYRVWCMLDNSDHNTSDNTPLMANSGKANASDDPFYAVREWVSPTDKKHFNLTSIPIISRNTQIFIDKIAARHEKFQDMVFNVNTATNTEFKDLRKGLVKDVRTADRQVKELKTRAVDMVSSVCLHGYGNLNVSLTFLRIDSGWKEPRQIPTHLWQWVKSEEEVRWWNAEIHQW